jgi:hypothetical protein
MKVADAETGRFLADYARRVLKKLAPTSDNESDRDE